LSAAVERLTPLPVLAGTVREVARVADDPDAATDQVAAAIERDEAFAANLLGFANSASAARPIRARTIRQAVTMLGRRAVVRLAREAATYQFLEQVRGTGGVARGQLHVHALTVASIAGAAAQRTGAAVDTAHLAGLLHDVGKLVLPLAVEANELDAIAAAEPVGARRAALERERLGVDHAYAGALLAECSGAGAEVVEAIAFHHGGRSGQDAGSAEAACVQLANALAAVLAGARPDAEVIHAALARLGLPHGALDELAERGLPAAAERPRDSLAARVQELERLASVDDLTGLSNRRHWLSEIRARLADEPGGGLLLCDVDHFKAINDHHGHRTGDLVLCEIARILTRHGFAGRLGGDEFAVWVPGDRPQALAAAQAILRDIDHELAAPGWRCAAHAARPGAAPAACDCSGSTAPTWAPRGSRSAGAGARPSACGCTAEPRAASHRCSRASATPTGAPGSPLPACACGTCTPPSRVERPASPAPTARPSPTPSARKNAMTTTEPRRARRRAAALGAAALLAERERRRTSVLNAPLRAYAERALTEPSALARGL
jgi:putative nucleotidyltransferase with HDIG domain